jgi:uncharacterized protein (DUF952 family)
MKGTIMVYHLCVFEDFIENSQGDSYSPAELNDKGYIQCMYSYQVMKTANHSYLDTKGLCVLSINEAKLTTDLKDEPALDNDERILRVCKPINLDAIEHISNLDKNENGFVTPLTLILPPLTQWVKDFPAEVSIMGKDGIMIGLNDVAIKAFEYAGGEKVIGENGITCHKPSSQKIIRDLIASQKSHSYIRYKPKSHPDCGIFCYQSPWYVDGGFMGLIEFVLPIDPDEIEKFKDASDPSPEY